MAITYLGNAEGVSANKKSYHQHCLNNLMKIESLEFKPYYDFFFFFFFGGGGGGASLLNLFPMQGFHR